MKNCCLLPFILLLIVSCSESIEYGDTGDSWPVVKQQGEGVLYALYVPSEGFAYRDKTGELTGVTIDLLNGFADFLYERYEINLEIRFVEETDWTRFYNRIVEGSDGLIGMGNVTITKERKEELTFSPPYMTNIASLISHEDAPELPSLEEISDRFSGRDALAFEGTLHETRLRQIINEYFPEAGIRMAQSNDEIIEIISLEDQFFAYIDIYNYWRAVERGKPLQRHEAGDEAAEQFGYIMPPGTSWEEMITEYFEHNEGLLESEQYRRIMKYHLGNTLAELLFHAQDPS